MADIKIKRIHNLEPEKLKERIQPIISETAKKYGLKYEWIGNNCKFEGQATGNLIIEQGEVHLSAKLSFAAKMFKGAIERHLNEVFEKALA